MYLFVFIFVILSVLGLYTELFTLRMAQLMSHQKSAAQTMMLWHGVANNYVRTNYASITVPPATGCSLTTGVPSCGIGALTLPSNAVSYLPIGYNYTDAEMQFETKLYNSGGAKYLVTYIPPGATKLGFTGGQMLQQMKNAGFPRISYGYVAAGTCQGGAGAGTWLMVDAYSSGAQICYSVETGGGNIVIPVGSVGIITII